MAADPVTAPLYPAACPSCGAAVRSDVAWCTLCYASLLPPPEPGPASEPEVPGAPGAGPGAPGDGGPGERAGEPAASPPDAVVQRLLAELAATRDPQPAWMSWLPQGRAGKAIVMIGGGAAASLLLLGLMALIGLFL